MTTRLRAAQRLGVHARTSAQPGSTWPRGPGRVGEALGTSAALYGHDLTQPNPTQPPLGLLAGWEVPDDLIQVLVRIGVSAAADWPNRFYVRGSAGVSRR